MFSFSKLKTNFNQLSLPYRLRFSSLRKEAKRFLYTNSTSESKITWLNRDWERGGLVPSLEIKKRKRKRRRWLSLPNENNRPPRTVAKFVFHTLLWRREMKNKLRQKKISHDKWWEIRKTVELLNFSLPQNFLKTSQITNWFEPKAYWSKSF